MATYFTTKEIAALFKISYDKALDFMKYSGVESVKIGRQYRVAEHKLNEFLYPDKTVKTLKKKPIYVIEDRSRR